MKKIINFKIVKKAFGLVLIFIGLFALVTPMTPGAWLIFIGAELLGWKFFLNHRLTLWLRNLLKRKNAPKENVLEKL